jgi:hypothetical protein
LHVVTSSSRLTRVYDLQQPHSMPYMCQSGCVRVRADRYGPVPLLPGLREDLARHGRGQDARHDRRIACRQTLQNARVKVELCSYEASPLFLPPFTCCISTSSTRNVVIPSIKWIGTGLENGKRIVPLLTS